jgi:hypothetical protein
LIANGKKERGRTLLKMEKHTKPALNHFINMVKGEKYHLQGYFDGFLPYGEKK